MNVEVKTILALKMMVELGYLFCNIATNMMRHKKAETYLILTTFSSCRSGTNDAHLIC
jgi:hypothetical protein